MIGTTSLHRLITARGPRWSVHGTIRQGEYAHAYALTADEADRQYERLTEFGHYTVRIVPPEGAISLTDLRDERIRARQTLADVEQRLKAACIAEIAKGRSEVEVARDAGVDRARTLRPWLGK
jgi:hypothetical protein